MIRASDENIVEMTELSRLRYGLLAIASFLFVVSLLPGRATPAVKATAATIYVSGTVSCQWRHVVGVWVESGGGGSGFADFRFVDRAHKNIATYAANIQNTSLPTNIRLHIGCGGSIGDWWSDNRTGSTSRAGGPLNGTTTLNAVCNEGTIRPPTGDNQRCWFGYASAASVWAIRHLSGVGASHALGSDLVDDENARRNWAGYCLAFVGAAYENSGVNPPHPYVHTTAHDMYNAYNAAGLIHSSGAPPVGALVFYPNLTSEGHIGISVGQYIERPPRSGEGHVLSATVRYRPSVHEQGYRTVGSRSAYYKGWAYPTNAFRGAS